MRTEWADRLYRLAAVIITGLVVAIIIWVVDLCVTHPAGAVVAFRWVIVIAVITICWYVLANIICWVWTGESWDYRLNRKRTER